MKYLLGALASAIAAASSARVLQPGPCAGGGQLITNSSGKLVVGDLSRTTFLPASTLCTYTIEGPPGSSISIVFDRVYLGRSSNCLPSSAGLFIYNSTNVDPSSVVCWHDGPANRQLRAARQLPAPRELQLAQAPGSVNGTGSVLIILDVKAAHAAYGFSLTWTISPGGNGTAPDASPSPSSAPIGSGNTTATGSASASASATPGYTGNATANVTTVETATPSASASASGSVTPTPTPASGVGSVSSTPTPAGGAPAVVLDPFPALIFDLPYTGRGFFPLTRPLVIRNHGTGPLTVTGAQIVGVDAPYGVLVSLGMARFPLLVPGNGGEVSLVLSCEQRILGPQASAPSFFMLQLDHNAPPGAGPHAVAVEVRITGAPASGDNGGGSSGGASPEDVRAAFNAGIGTAYGALFGLIAMGAVCYWRCFRKRGPKFGSGAGGGSSGSGSSRGIGSSSSSSGAPPKISTWDLLFGDPKKLRAAQQAAAAKAQAAAARGAGSGAGSAGAGSGSSGGDEEEEEDGSGYGYRRRGGDEERVALSGKKPPQASIGELSSAGGGPSGTGFGGASWGIQKGGGAAAGSSQLSAARAASAAGGFGSISSGPAQGIQLTPVPGAGAPSLVVSAGVGVGSAGAAGGSEVDGDGLSLVSKPQLKASEFEGRWAALPTVELWGCTLSALPPVGALEKALGSAGVACIASGALNGVSKFYFHAQEASPVPGDAGALIMVEVTIAHSSLRLSAVVKAPGPFLGARFARLFRRLVAPFAAEGQASVDLQAPGVSI